MCIRDSAKAVTNLLGHHQRAANGCFGQNHRKVLATEAGDGIGRAFRMPADGVGDPAQAVVAGQVAIGIVEQLEDCLLYTSPSPRDRTSSRMPSSACKQTDADRGHRSTPLSWKRSSIVPVTGLLARLPPRRLPIFLAVDSGLLPVRLSGLQLQEKPRYCT